jgi:hypothetical protein
MDSNLLSIRHPILDIAAGHSFRVTAKFRASELLGLPSTADRDKFLALMKIVSEERARIGTVQNPIRFSGYPGDELKQKLCDVVTERKRTDQFFQVMSGP